MQNLRIRTELHEETSKLKNPSDCLIKTKRPYEPPFLQRLDEIKPQSGTYSQLNENTNGVLAS